MDRPRSQSLNPDSAPYCFPLLWASDIICPIELSVMMDTVHICTIQCGHHWPHRLLNLCDSEHELVILFKLKVSHMVHGYCMGKLSSRGRIGQL